MLNKLRVWIEMIKNIEIFGSMFRDIKLFYRGNIIQTLQTEGWFEFLDSPHTKDEIMENFKYSEKELLTEIIEILIADNTLKKNGMGKYQTVRPINTSWIIPKAYGEIGKELWLSFARALPNRLRGQYFEFSGGFNLYDWDEILSFRLYDVTRRCSFIFAKVDNQAGKFLDVGCGNGWGTSSIWALYYKKGWFNPLTGTNITGIDVDTNLLKIAQNEFPRMIKKQFKQAILDETIENQTQFFPEFKVGSAISIPFEADTFDQVFSSHVLHWTNTPVALKEMLRVCKRGGVVFGAQATYPFANHFADLHTRVIKGAKGFFSQNDLVQWGKQAGAVSVDFISPGFFKMKK